MNSERDIIKQCPQGEVGLYGSVPVNTARTVGEACDKFFESRNIDYGNSWFHKRQKRKKEQEQTQNEQRDTNN